MSESSKDTRLAMGGLGLAMGLCCGLPLLLAAGALGSLGAVLASPWVIGAAVAALIGAIVWLRRRATGSVGAACCPPPPEYDQAPGVDQPSTRSPER